MCKGNGFAVVHAYSDESLTSPLFRFYTMSWIMGKYVHELRVLFNEEYLYTRNPVSFQMGTFA